MNRPRESATSRIFESPPEHLSRERSGRRKRCEMGGCVTRLLTYAALAVLWFPACAGLRPGVLPAQSGILPFRVAGRCGLGPRLAQAAATTGLHGGVFRAQGPVGAGLRGTKASAGEEQRVAALNSWLKERGILRDSVEVGRCGDMGLGLRATREISGNQEVVMEVLPEHFISEETAVASLGELGAFIKATLQDALVWGTGGDVSVELGDALIALVLMKEMAKGDSSEMKPYIDMLPPSVDTPLFWPEEERDALLKGCLVLQDTRWLQASMDNQWALVSDMVIAAFPDLFPPEHFNLERFRYCVALSISRAYSADGISGVGEGLLLLPGIDMTNHADEVEFAVQGGDGVFAERGSVTLVTDRPYPAGGQVFTTYGRKSNAQMLYAFGFARDDPHHPHNSADFALELPYRPLPTPPPLLLGHAGVLLAVRCPGAKGEVLSHHNPPLSNEKSVPVRRELADMGLRLARPGGAAKAGASPMFAPLVESWGSALPYARLCCAEGGWLRGHPDLAEEPGKVWERMYQPLEGGAEAEARAMLVSAFDGMIEAIGSPGGGGGGARARAAEVVKTSEAAALRAGRAAVLGLGG